MKKIKANIIIKLSDGIAMKRLYKTISKKSRKRNIKFYKGKETYDKYGVYGLNGIIEINNKKIETLLCHYQN